MPDLHFEAVIVTYNSAEYIRPCLASLQKAGARIVIVDNSSFDETVSIIGKEFPEVRLISAKENLGYGKGLNLGIAKTSSPIILAANADTVFSEDSLQALAKFLEDHPRAGVAGPQQLFPDGSWQRSYGDIHGICEGIKTLIGVTSLAQTIHRVLLRFSPARSSKSVGYVDGAVMMIRREAFNEIGGFDEDFPYYCEDADLCLRLRDAAWDVVHVPSVHVTHVRGGSSTKVEGYSDKYLRAQATARYQLVRKHSPGWCLWLYRQISILHARKMILIYRALQILGPASYAQHASMMALTFKRWAAHLSRSDRLTTEIPPLAQ